MSQGVADHLTIAGGQTHSPVTHLCPLVALLRCPMGFQLMTMYDEFKIVSFKLKISPQVGAIGAQLG